MRAPNATSTRDAGSRVPPLARPLGRSAASSRSAVSARGAPPHATPRRVLLVFSNGRLLPANVEFEAGLRAELAGLAEGHVELFEEFLDSPRFEGQAHAENLAACFGRKYRGRAPDLIVTAAMEALQFTLESRARAFPRIPVVHAAVAPDELETLGMLPSDVVGVPCLEDFHATADLALRWHPRARRLVVVTGTSARDRRWEARLSRDLSQLGARAGVEPLTGLATEDLLSRLARLGRESVVLTPGYLQDGAGRRFWPRDAVLGMARASGAPVYSTASTYLGTGVVGGYVVDYHSQGRQAARVVNEVLAGAAVGSLRLPGHSPPVLHVDWRQVKRWGIHQRNVPAHAVIHFRRPPFHEAYRKEVAVAAGVLVLQVGLIGGLLLERRRRRVAQLTAQRHRFELAHASRVAVAGELAGAIAHEINQPLGAILSNADAADLVLGSGRDQHELLTRILADVRRDAVRASEVIRRLRVLLQEQQVESRRFDVNDAVTEVGLVLRPEATRRRVWLDVRPSSTPAHVVGDAIQLQQVLINLALNAMEAMGEVPDDRRTVQVSVEPLPGSVSLTVRDTGPGIPAEHLGRIFESFFTTKHAGMGLGLSIARTLVEAHGGSIRAENGRDSGAVFRIDLPVATTAGASSPDEP